MTNLPALDGATQARLDAQMGFLMEASRLQSIVRATRIADGSRYENSAEHSWHLAVYALMLCEHAPEPVDTGKVIAMLLIHDIVEIDAGDVPIFGDVDAAAQAAAEAQAADRLFGLLPADQAAHFRALWDEFEAADSPEARFAKSLDRFQPPNLNLAANGGSWAEYGVTEDVFRQKVAPRIARGAPKLMAWLSPKISAFFTKG